jgi:hypothetical protein
MMEGNPLRDEHAEHHAVQELLPWFAMDALAAEDLQLVRRHLQSCRRCRADAASQRRLRASLAPDGAESDADISYRKLLGRLRRPARPGSSPPRRMRMSWERWTLAGLAASLALLLLAPVSIAPRYYHGLGSAGGTSGNIVVSFRPDTSEQKIRQVLRETGARLVDGPTAADAYVLRVERSEQERALVALRREQAVSMAEPLDAKAGP